MNELSEHLRSALSATVEDDLAWTRQSRRGRWMVVESMPRVSDSPHVQAIVDATTPRRGRRFSSLSRARAFANLVGGRVARRDRRKWQSVSPWERATKTANIGTLSLMHFTRRAHLRDVP